MKPKIADLPFGSVIEYRGVTYWHSKGLDANILTAADGHWFFVREVKWRNWKLIHEGSGK